MMKRRELETGGFKWKWCGVLECSEGRIKNAETTAQMLPLLGWI
jgi:hypothetical protein